uniref:Uncharacterized protein n=1 Tax=Arundo donax TaxID=35708 RepID=A0A0A9BNB7_ARUDO
MIHDYTPKIKQHNSLMHGVIQFINPREPLNMLLPAQCLISITYRQHYKRIIRFMVTAAHPCT